MHNFFAGLMGLFMGVTSFIHGGQNTPTQNLQPTAVQQTSLSGTPGMMQGQKRMNLPVGERPFFGTVTAVNGATLTLQMRMGRHTTSPSITPPSPRTLTITLDSATTYKGGSATDITTTTKLAGIGKTNSDGTLTAISVQINPTMPNGFPGRKSNPHAENNGI